MGAWYFKQPNGLYGRFSSIVDTVTDYNMNEKELRQNMMERLGARDIDVINFDEFLQTYGKSEEYGFGGRYHIHLFEDVLKHMTAANEDTKSAQHLLIDMGMPKEEAKKYYFMPRPADDDDKGWDNYEIGLKKKE